MRSRARAILFLIALALPACGPSTVPTTAPAPAPPKLSGPLAQPLEDEIPADQLDNVIRAHYQGIGAMERYEYHAAAAAFREVHERAPGWIPGSVNLAIALLNDVGNQEQEAKTSARPSATGSANFDEALALLDGVLARAPENLHARYCRAVIHEDLGKLADANRDYQHVADSDPTDAHALYKVGATYTNPADPTKPAEINDAPRLIEIYTKVLERNPYLVPAYYKLQQAYSWASIKEKDPEKKTRLLTKQRALMEKFLRTDPDKSPTGTGDAVKTSYGEAGRYARVINPFSKPADPPPPAPAPRFDAPTPIQVRLPDGERWVKTDDFTGAFALFGRVRARFGATIAAFDANGDGRTDLFLASAVKTEQGIRDALLLNTADGAFEDVSRAWGLSDQHPSLGAAAGDFDADRKIDLFLCGPSGYQLLRNEGKAFKDVSSLVGLDKHALLGLTARWLDLDQDGDLDLYVVNYTDLASAAKAFAGESPNVVNSAFRNIGKAAAIAGRPADNWAPLAVATSDLPAKEGLSLALIPWPDGTDLNGPPRHWTGIAMLDFDEDRDLDLALAAENEPPFLIANERQGTFRTLEPTDKAPRGPSCQGLLVMDFDKDGQADLVGLPPSQSPVLERYTRPRVKNSSMPFAMRIFDRFHARPWRCAIAADIDLDTWPDLIGLPEKSDIPALEWARNERDQFTTQTLPLAPALGDVTQLEGFALEDLVGDPLPDVLLLANGHAPRIARNRGNGNHWLALDLGGRWKTSHDHMRTNPHGLGTRITLEGQGLLVTYDHTTTSAGLGQSIGPVVLGLGNVPAAELIHLRWPDGTMQCELNAKADVKMALTEYNRKTGSCPVLFTWNGARFVCLGDFLGGGGLGYLVAPGVYGQPDRDESVAIAADQLKPVDGVYRLSITEPMDEVAYLDRLELVVVDRPPGVSATPEERFAPEGPRPSGDVIAWKTAVEPSRATDLKGNDVTKALQAWDRQTVDTFRKREGWIGYAEEHGIVLDFGDRLSRFGTSDRLVLMLAGWVEYPYSQTNYAAATAGVALKPPVIERRQADGSWRVIEPHAGYPAGMPRLTALELSGKLSGPSCVIRIKTNMECYYDQAFVAVRDASAESALRVTPLGPARAVLGYRGYTREVSPDGKPPLLYDYDHVDPAPLAFLGGMLTRYGDVRPLLTNDDDQLCLVGPGDEVRLEFDARTLPTLPAGWTRGFVLKSVGYCKDADPFTASGDRVDPLPWRAMPAFPFARPTTRPDDPAYRAYLQTYQTRPAGGL